jgi:hypothetical protein
MRFAFFLQCLPAVALVLPGLSVAQAPDPAGAPAWRSAFEGYQPFAEAPVAPWRESNDTVGRIGGWRAYARESQAPAASEPARAAPAVKPASPLAPPASPAPAAGHTH